MKVAVPVFHNDVSPRFGASTRLLVADVDETGVRVESEEDLSGTPPWKWPDLFAQLGIAKVICGGIHEWFHEELERRGMQVIWGVIGPATEALAALQKGTLRSDQFVCRRHRARRGAGGGGPPGWGRGQRRRRGPGPWRTGQNEG